MNTASFEHGATASVARLCRRCPHRRAGRSCTHVIARSAAMRSLLDRVAPIAASDAPVVIMGESGAGKEVLAEEIHINSPRAAKPFVPINVGALPPDLLESELFGHARGAFTGAIESTAGLFHEANGGTLLLDEIAEMPLPLQVKLLRALQAGEVRRVGDARPTSVDVRVLCATNRDLMTAVERGLFREDLYYRLSVFVLTVPPLRERREDLLPLVELFFEREGVSCDRLTDEARMAFAAHRWPGNVRELKNAVKHAAVLAEGGPIGTEHLPFSAPRAPKPSPVDDSQEIKPLAEVEREHILRAYELSGHRCSEAARLLGIGRTTLWRKLKIYGIDATD